MVQDIDAQTILSEIPQAFDIAKRTLTYFKQNLHRFNSEVDNFGNFESLFLSLVNKKKSNLNTTMDLLK